MITATGKTITVESVNSQCEAACNRIAAMVPMKVGIIEGYPIGRQDRGKCELSVERKSFSGFRTVRRTTNRNGIWCAPKKSTYMSGPIVVVQDPGSPSGRDIKWLIANRDRIYLQCPNGDTIQILLAPHWCKPRRMPETVRMVTRTARMHIDGNGVSAVNPTEDVSEHVYPADPVELCDAYDAWQKWHESIVVRIHRMIDSVN